MTILGSILPGLREIRGPVVAGYLWLLLLWLLLDPQTPSPDEGGLYAQLVSLSEDIGPIGQAVAASVAAYLLGSVSTSLVLRWADQFDEAQSFRESLRDRGVRESDDIGTLRRSFEGWVPLDLLSQIAGATFEDLEWEEVEGDWQITESLNELTRREIEPHLGQIESAVSAARSDADEDAHLTFQLVNRGAGPVARLRVESPNSGIAFREEMGSTIIERDFPIPLVALSRDLGGRLSLLHTRLTELVPPTGQKIERIQAESEFRLAVVVPLALLLGLCAVEISALWLAALTLPVALLVSGYALRRQRKRELVDALRARDGEELQKLTPVFAHFSAQADALANAIRSADWTHSKPATDLPRSHADGPPVGC